MSNLFNYPEALTNVFAGNRVARKEWVERDQWLFLVKAEEFDKLTFNPHVNVSEVSNVDQIWIKTSKGTMGPYGGCNCDTTAEDWTLV